MTTAADELRQLQREAERYKYENMFAFQCDACGFPEREHEYVVPGDEFLKNKPFDFAWSGQRILVEIDGGTWTRTGYGRSGGHAHPKRIEQDNAKRNRARLLGWRVFQFTGGQVERGEAAGVMAKVFTKVQVS